MTDLNILDLISQVEELRQAKVLNNEQANLIEEATKLNADDAVLANRAISRGADPFSIQYLALGEVSPHIRMAHFNGPGSLEGEERDDWLLLASFSVDEHGEPISVRGKIMGLVEAVNSYLEMSGRLLGGQPRANTIYTDSLKLQRARRVERVLNQITSLEFTTEIVGEREMRVFTADLGFAAAYWSGEECAAVRQPDGLVFVGSKGETLTDLGIEVNKQLSPQFGIIFP